MRNALATARRREARLGTVEAQALEQPDQLEAIWDEESRSALMHSALDRLAQTDTDSTTIEAFRRTFVDGVAPKDVAETLGISINSVYLAKNRCLTRLRKIVEQMEETWELHT